MNDKPVLVVARNSLRRGQASLYDLIVSKVQTGDKITLEEARDIWMTKVCRKIRNGVPHRSEYYPAQDGTNNWYLRDVPMTEEQILFTVLNWLTKNIGILVIRGYLKVVPMIELEPSKPKTSPHSSALSARNTSQ